MTKFLLFTGTVQTFTAPVSGWYDITCFGACGGCYIPGGKTWGQVHMNVAQTYYVFVGELGRWAWTPDFSNFNGGGRSNNIGTGNYASGCHGGGATHVSSTNNRIYSGSAWNSNGTLVIAGGGGGGHSHASYSSDTWGFGGLWNNTAYAQGRGQSGGDCVPGGGAGWYGGRTRGDQQTGYGGSSWVTNSARSKGTQVGGATSGPGYCTIYLNERD